MTQLRQRMIECLQLRGLSERTQESYVQAVRQLAEHYHKSPDLITEEELQQYFLHLKNVKKYASSSLTIALCGINPFRNRAQLVGIRAHRQSRRNRKPFLSGRRQGQRAARAGFPFRPGASLAPQRVAFHCHAGLGPADLRDRGHPRAWQGRGVRGRGRRLDRGLLEPRRPAWRECRRWHTGMEPITNR